MTKTCVQDTFYLKKKMFVQVLFFWRKIFFLHAFQFYPFLSYLYNNG